MTYLVGAKCRDGVVLVSDSRLLANYQVSDGNKILHIHDKIVIGSTGTLAIFTKLKDQLKESMNTKQLDSQNKILHEIEGIMIDLKDRYQHVQDIGSTDILTAIIDLDVLPNKIRLFEICDDGLSQEINGIIAMGHGAPYGDMLLKSIWNPQKTMTETVALVTLIINMIESFGLDTSVDGSVQAILVSNNGVTTYWSWEDVQKNGKITKQMAEKFNNALKEINQILHDNLGSKILESKFDIEKKIPDAE